MKVDFILILIVSGILLSDCKSSLRGKPAPQNVNCGTSGSHPHCYAIGKIGNILTRVTGFSSTFTVVNSSKGGADQNGLITNEIWLNSRKFGAWIEVGCITNQQGQRYFWAYRHPTTGDFFFHTIRSPIPKEEINTRVTFDIHQIDDGAFSISVHGLKTHFDTIASNIPLWDAFDGGGVHIGQELGGTKTTARSSLCMFTQNQVYDTSLKKRFLLETDLSDPSESIDRPPFGSWMQKPIPGSKGGVFITYCCLQ